MSGAEEVPHLTPAELAYTNKASILGQVCSFTVIATVLVLLRVYVRLAMLKTFGSDDYTMVAAMALSFASMICFILETQHGLGKKTLAIPPDELEKFFFVQFFHNIFVVIAVCLVKISVSCFLLRLVQRPAYIRLIWGIIIFLAFVAIASTGTLIFACVPVQAAWDFSLRPPVGDATCFSNHTYAAIGLTNSGVNIVTDFILATLPIPILWNLQINRRTKATLAAILSLGYFACAAAIAKCVSQQDLGAPDWTVEDSFAVWFDIEMNVGIIAATLPTLKPLFNWALETVRSTVQISSGTRNRYGRSRPSVLGYQKQGASIKLTEIKGQSSKSENDPYSVHVGAGSQGMNGTKHWNAGGDNHSDDSVLPLHCNDDGILRTTEVTID